MASSVHKGNKVKLSTFMSWCKDDILGYKTEEVGGVTFVVSIWCKVCSRNSSSILLHPTCRGTAKKAMQLFIDGTNGVTKHNVDRHLKGKAHEIALNVEKDKPVAERMNLSQASSSGRTQTTIVSSMKNAAFDAYKRMFRTAYELALNPTMPLKHYYILIKCQKQNGVSLIKGKQDGRAAAEFLTYIAKAVSSKVSSVLAEKDFFSTLSDGTQPKKSGSEKELVLTRVERGGLPVYFLTSLLEMSDHGGADAASLKKAIDGVYTNEMELSNESYQTKMIGATADGASVNTGAFNGLLTKMKSDRPWLVTIHCANHRTELAVKEAMNRPMIKDAEELYAANYSLLRRSSIIQAQVQKASEVLGITHYVLPKIHGTRFISHRYRGFDKFLHMIPPLILGYENALTHVTRPETKAKLLGLVKKLKDAKQLLNVCVAVDILEKARPASLVFEEDGLILNEVYPSIQQTVTELQELSQCSEDEVPVDSNLRYFTFTTDESDENLTTISRMYYKEGHERRKPCNREFVSLKVEKIRQFSQKAMDAAFCEAKQVAVELVAIFNRRFEDHSTNLFKSMEWLDPKSWNDSSDYGLDQIITLYEHFQQPLDAAGFDAQKIRKEWKQAKCFIRAHYPLSSEEVTARKVWQNMITARKQEYPNICMMASLVLCLSGSNSSVERSFSVLKMILSDLRLAMQHKTLKDIMMIKCNNRNWSIEEKEEILSEAVKEYLSKRRTTQTTNSDEEPPEKIRKVVEYSQYTDDNDSTTNSSDSTGEGYSESDSEHSQEDCMICNFALTDDNVDN